MPANREQIVAILTSPDFSEGEKFVVKAQFNHAFDWLSNFEQKLWEVLCAADHENWAKLLKVFPQEAIAVRDWKEGGLGDRIRAAGCNI